MPLTWRPAREGDSPLLADMNRQLIQDEGHWNRMDPAQLETRMRGWLAERYKATVFETDGKTAGYALWREETDLVYLRQYFTCRDMRRLGIGRRAMRLLREEVWPGDKRLVVEVLLGNAAAISFWKAVGYREYCLKLQILPENQAGPE